MVLAALLVMAVGGTAAVVYFAMDAPRRQGQAATARARRETARAEEGVTRVREESRRLAARSSELAAAAAAHRQAVEASRRLAGEREEALAVERRAFDRRLVGYDELAVENRRLKADLRNLVVELDRREYAAAVHGAATASVAAQRNDLGRDLFDAARAIAGRVLSPGNYPATKHRLQATGDRVRAAGGDLSAAEVAAAMADLHAQYERAVRVAAEREHQAELRERMREEVRRERDAQIEIEQAERERSAVAAALARALADATGRHAAEVDQLREQLAEAEARSARAVSQAQLTRAGTVYVISNPGSFGRDVVKIGMSRRLEPMERVQELSGAAVPFPFDVHLMIACDDAPRLEAALHRRFHLRRVNKVNLRKEFFRVPVEEIAAAVRAEHGEVQYTADAEALEFAQSQTMTDADLAEVERAFAAADAATEPPDDPEG